jgi:hypothetical protein
MADATADQVRALVAHVIAAQEFAGKPALLDQVPFLQIAGGPITFLDLKVCDPAAPRSALENGPVPGQSWVHDEQGEPIGGLLVWVREGFITALEYFWVTDEPPTCLPDLRRVATGRHS